VLGPVTIGAHSLVGAHAVVVNDAPPFSVITGIPAIARPRTDSARPVEVDDPGIYI
jgi:serine O-acetyltransferase